MTLSDHQRFTLVWTIPSSLIMLAVGMATTVIALGGPCAMRWVIVETELLAEKDAE
jgi:hypothetical protein